tara:strand:- start:9307 stop:10176 length:870 start_codon:yes stop_codon:yes gene_type:complete
MSDSNCNCPCKQQGHPWCILPSYEAVGGSRSDMVIPHPTFRGSGFAGVYDVIPASIFAIIKKCPVDETPAEDQYNCVVNAGITPHVVNFGDDAAATGCWALPEVQNFLNRTGYTQDTLEPWDGITNDDTDYKGSIEFVFDPVPSCVIDDKRYFPTVTYRVAYLVNCESGNYTDQWKPCIDEILKSKINPPTARLECNPSPCTKIRTRLVTVKGWPKATTIDYYDKYVDAGGTDTNGIRVLHDVLERQEDYTGKVFVGTDANDSGIAVTGIFTSTDAYPSGETPWGPPLI